MPEFVLSNEKIKVVWRCIVGVTVGSAPGLAVRGLGYPAQGLGLMIIGSVLGVLIAVSGLVYDTTGWTTFKRGLLLFIRWTAAKNIPGGAALVPIDEGDTRLRKHVWVADPKLLGARMWLGCKWGAIVAICPAVSIAIYVPLSPENEESLVVEVLMRFIMGMGFISFLGGVLGTAFGALTVRGVHRRNIVVGTLLGVCVGLGLATATYEDAKISVLQVYMGGGMLFGYLGLLLSLFAGENTDVQNRPRSDSEDET